MMPVRGAVLVVGAREGSLGAAVQEAAYEAGFSTYTAGINKEDHLLNLVGDSLGRITEMLMEVQPRHIVCTVGINQPQEGQDFAAWMDNHYLVNAVGPMRLLQAWHSMPAASMLKAWPKPQHFVAVSSNSAVIARTNSMAYCASKAALSMALRVAAREASGGDHGYIVYGYEPGWLRGTPMSNAVQRRFGGHGVPGLHKMRGQSLAQGVSSADLAAQIVAGLGVPGAALNGSLIRYDGGEQ